MSASGYPDPMYAQGMCGNCGAHIGVLLVTNPRIEKPDAETWDVVDPIRCPCGMWTATFDVPIADMSIPIEIPARISVDA